ncbi:hypothetical protein D3C76_1588630 [compost metagenome]
MVSVLRTSTDTIRVMQATTTSGYQARPYSIRINFHWETAYTSAVDSSSPSTR